MGENMDESHRIDKLPSLFPSLPPSLPPFPTNRRIPLFLLLRLVLLCLPSAFRAFFIGITTLFLVPSSSLPLSLPPFLSFLFLPHLHARNSHTTPPRSSSPHTK